jgi:hypothetical protein
MFEDHLFPGLLSNVEWIGVDRSRGDPVGLHFELIFGFNSVAQMVHSLVCFNNPLFRNCSFSYIGFT